MDTDFIVYGLVDPQSGQLRYVGKSITGLKRPQAHSRASVLAREETNHRANWLRSVASSGQKPGIVVLEECPDPIVLYEHEQFWIRYFRQMGCPLTNATDGGPGLQGLKRAPFTAEHKARMSASHKARTRTPLSPETKAKIGAANRGRIPSPEARAKMSAAGVRRWASLRSP